MYEQEIDFLDKCADYREQAQRPYQKEFNQNVREQMRVFKKLKKKPSDEELKAIQARAHKDAMSVTHQTPHGTKPSASTWEKAMEHVKGPVGKGVAIGAGALALGAGAYGANKMYQEHKQKKALEGMYGVEGPMYKQGNFDPWGKLKEFFVDTRTTASNLKEGTQDMKSMVKDIRGAASETEHAAKEIGDIAKEIKRSGAVSDATRSLPQISKDMAQLTRYAKWGLGTMVAAGAVGAASHIAGMPKVLEQYRHYRDINEKLKEIKQEQRDLNMGKTASRKVEKRTSIMLSSLKGDDDLLKHHYTLTYKADPKAPHKEQETIIVSPDPQHEITAAHVMAKKAGGALSFGKDFPDQYKTFHGVVGKHMEKEASQKDDEIRRKESKMLALGVGTVAGVTAGVAAHNIHEQAKHNQYFDRLNESIDDTFKRMREEVKVRASRHRNVNINKGINKKIEGINRTTGRLNQAARNMHASEVRDLALLGALPVGVLGVGALAHHMRKKKHEKKAEEIPGGKAEGHTPDEFNQNDLKKGMKIEKEHTPVKAKQREISMDHIIEVKKKDGDGKWTSSYYDEMPAFEKEVEKTSSLKDIWLKALI
jgi:methylthioribose-1-phosphate isomerase/preprotein translocase subunit Sss1